MNRPTQATGEKDNLQLTYKRAGILDIPLIFQLIQEGAESGSFSQAFIERRGSLKILAYVWRNIARQYIQSRRLNDYCQWLVIKSADNEVGFMKLSKSAGSCSQVNLELIAICPENRNSGIANAVLEKLVSEIPCGGQLNVHCTKYARAMQHILKKHHLKRNVKFNVPYLEEYQTGWIELGTRGS